MADTSIRVSAETKTRLDLVKRSGESYDDVIRRLTQRDKWAGFGALADETGETADGMARVRRSLRAGMQDDIVRDE